MTVALDQLLRLGFAVGDLGQDTGIVTFIGAESAALDTGVDVIHTHRTIPGEIGRGSEIIEILIAYGVAAEPEVGVEAVTA